MATDGELGIGNLDEYKAVDLASRFDLIWPSMDNITNEVSDCKVDCNVNSNVTGACINVKEEGLELAV